MEGANGDKFCTDNSEVHTKPAAAEAGGYRRAAPDNAAAGSKIRKHQSKICAGDTCAPYNHPREILRSERGLPAGAHQ